MSNELQGLPRGIGDFGYEFNYAVWTPGTTISMHNVPWGMDYRDIVDFGTEEELLHYLRKRSGPVITFERAAYVKPGNPVRVSVPFTQAQRFNYLRVYNDMSSGLGVQDEPTTYYYFITDVKYVAPNTTELQVQVDVWQTYGRWVTFGNCFVERGHVAIANANNFADHGREYLTVPEGLDIGNEYVIHDVYTKEIASTKSGTQPHVIVTSTTSLVPPYKKSDGSPDLKTATGSAFSGLPGGCDLYWFTDTQTFHNFMGSLRDYPWVAQGIVSIMAVPPLTDAEVQYEEFELSGWKARRVKWGMTRNFRYSLDGSAHWRDNIPLTDRYANLNKFKVFPYTVCELTTYSGTPLTLKPECIPTEDMQVVRLSHYTLPSPRISFYPYRYNSRPDTPVTIVGKNDEVLDDRCEGLDMTTGIFNLPTLSVVNSGTMQFMAANAHSIAYQRANADWSQQKALTGNQLSYNQAQAGIALGNQLTNLGIGAANASTALANETLGYKSIQSGVNSALGGLSSALGGNVLGGLSGALTGGANAAADYAIGTNQNNQQNAINNSLAAASQSARASNSAWVADTNKSYADFAAKGDYQSTIAAINAKVQDASLIQPTTAGQVGGEAFNLVTTGWAVYFKVKTLQASVRALIGEYWLRYGYAINRFMVMPENLSVMEKFTYWKLRETYLSSSSCPEGFKQAIRGIFEKGVTVWTSPDYIGMIDIADNEPISRIYY